jgi:hypothetical protein
MLNSKSKVDRLLRSEWSAFRSGRPERKRLRSETGPRTWRPGDRGVIDELMPVVRDELHRLALSYFALERS